ncbi:hypothetical protein LPJ59_004818, partial [Coemansia sp. RSA 2399]
MVRHIGRDSSANYGLSRRDSDTNDGSPTEGADAGKRNGGRAKGSVGAKKVVFRPSVRPLPLGSAAKAGAPPMPPPPPPPPQAVTSLLDGGSGNRSRSSTAGPVGRLVNGRRNNTTLNGDSPETGLRKNTISSAVPASNKKDMEAMAENPWVARARRSTAPPVPAISNVSVEASPTLESHAEDIDNNVCGGDNGKVVVAGVRQQDKTLDNAVDYSDDATEKTISKPAAAAAVVVEIPVSPQPALPMPPSPPVTQSDEQRPSSVVEPTTFASEPGAPTEQPLCTVIATPPAIGIWDKPIKIPRDVSGHSDAEAAPVSDSARWWKARLSGASRSAASEPESSKSASSSRLQSLTGKGSNSQSATSLLRTPDSGAKLQRGSRRHQAPIPTVVPPRILARATPAVTSTKTPAATATTSATAAPANPPESKPAPESLVSKPASNISPIAEPVKDSIPVPAAVEKPAKDSIPVPAAVDKPVETTDQTAKKRTATSDTKHAINWRSKPESKTPAGTEADKLMQRNPLHGIASSPSLSSDSTVESKPRLPPARRRSSVATKNSTGSSTGISTTKPRTVSGSWRSDSSRARRSQSVAASVASPTSKQPLAPTRQPPVGDIAIGLGNVHVDQFSNLLKIIPPTTSMPHYRGMHSSSPSSSPQVHSVTAVLSSSNPSNNNSSSSSRPQQPLLPHAMLADILDDSGHKNQQNVSSSTSLFNLTANPLLSPPDTAATPSSRGNYPLYSENLGSGVMAATSAPLGSNLYSLPSGASPLWTDPSSMGGSGQTPQPPLQPPKELQSRSQGDASYKGPARVPPQPIGTRGTRSQKQQQQHQQQHQQQQHQQWIPYHPTPLELSGQYNAPLPSGDMHANHISQAPQYLAPPPQQSMMVVPAMHIPHSMHAPEGYSSGESHDISMPPPFVGMVPAQHLLGPMHSSPPVAYPPAYGYSGVLGPAVQPSPYVSYPQPQHFNAPHLDYMNIQMAPHGYGSGNSQP